MRAFSDTDFASCPWTAKSTSGIVIGVQTGEAFFPVFWQSKKQSSVARSTSEAESIALASTMYGEVLHIQEMLGHLFEVSIPVKFEQDNEAADQDHPEQVLCEIETLQSRSSRQYCIYQRSI